MKSKGFTLIELLIVVAIIAVLAAIAVPNFLEAQTRSKVSRIKSDMRALGIALESYRTDQNDYPQAYVQSIPKNQYWPSLGWLYVEFSNKSYDPRMVGRYLTTPIAYMTSIPLDPFTSEYALKKSREVGSWGGMFHFSSVWYGMRYNAPCYVQPCVTVGGRPFRTYENVGYYMDSVGPDLYLEYGLPNYDSSGKNPNVKVPFQYVPYDPTNGSVSNGEIVYIGRGIGFH